MEITGTRGAVRFSTFGQEPLRLTGANGDQEIAAPYPQAVAQPLIQAVVDALTGRGECPSTGQSAARTARVVRALLADYRAQADLGR